MQSTSCRAASWLPTDQQLSDDLQGEQHVHSVTSTQGNAGGRMHFSSIEHVNMVQ